MTSPSELIPDVDEISRKLLDAGLIKSKRLVDLAVYKPAYVRRSKARRWHYHVTADNQSACHLVVGMDLAGVNQRAQNLFAACPELICQPLLYWENAERMGFLCIKHFEGESLDDMVKSDRIAATSWLEKVTHAEILLKKTTRPSTKEALQEEVQILLKEVGSVPGLTKFDATLLSELVAPVLVNSVGAEPYSTQWTNGDFTGGNLLVNERGEVRLVDYEYAQVTHFHSVDWLRLKNFSVLPANFDPVTLPDYEDSLRPENELHFWISHLAHLKNAEVESEIREHISEVISGIFRALARAHPQNSADTGWSFLLRFLSERLSQSEDRAQERTVWAQRLEADLRKVQTLFTEEAAKLKERTAWALRLEGDLAKARAVVIEQNAKFEERSTWAKSLEVEVQQSQDQLVRAQERLTQLDGEYMAQNRWAISLEHDLAETRQHFDRLTQEHSERTKWAYSLSKELEEAKANFVKLTLAYDERTAWAVSLQTELKSHADQIADLTSLNNAYVAELESIQTEKLKVQHALKESEQRTLAVQRDILTSDAAIRQAHAKAADGESALKVLRPKLQMLERAISDGQQHIDHLLLQVATARDDASAQQKRAKSDCDMHQTSIANLQAQVEHLRRELGRYESSVLCRWLAGPRKPPRSSNAG